MKSARTHLILVSVVALFAVTGFFVWYGVITNKSAQAAQLQSQITAETQMIGRIAADRASLAEASASEAQIRSYFVSSSNIVPFINALQDTGTRLGTTVKVLSVAAGGSKTQSAVDLSLTISGSFDAVMRTVGAIEYAQYAVTITSLSAQASKGGWSANLSLTVESSSNTRSS